MRKDIWLWHEDCIDNEIGDHNPKWDDNFNFDD